MQRTGQYTLREVEQFTRPDPQLEQLFQADADYAEYRAQFLMGSFGIRAAWKAEQQARGGRGSRGGGRGRGGGAGQRGATLPTLSWTVDVVTAQGVSGFVEIPQPAVETPAFIAEV